MAPPLGPLPPSARTGVQTLTQLPLQPLPQPCALVFGNLDGVHLGHRALLAQARQRADAWGGPVRVVTFDPHPLLFLRPDRAPAALDTLDGRLRWLAALGVDETYVLHFDATLAAIPATTFARDWLCGLLHARAFVVGPDMHFGHARQGNAHLLQQMADAVGASVARFDGVALHGERVSSSRIRHAVRDGHTSQAAELLGRPFCTRGTVVHGDARGRTIGFPTANVSAPTLVQPQNGIYAGVARVGDRFYDAAISQGTRPTFDGVDVRTEAYLLDFSSDIYGQSVEIFWIERLRGELAFAGVEPLVVQITQDVVDTRSALSRWRALTPDWKELLK